MRNRVFEFRVWDKSVGSFIVYSNIEPYLNNDNFVVQQYTGQKDSNRIEIFEGDICKDTWSENQPYGYSPDEWYNNEHVFTVIWESPSFVFPSYSGQCIENFRREVIGNIFSKNVSTIND